MRRPVRWTGRLIGFRLSFRLSWLQQQSLIESDWLQVKHVAHMSVAAGMHCLTKRVEPERGTVARSFTVDRSILKWIAGVLAGGAAVVAAPQLLGALAPEGTNWGRLSDISQTYGTPLSIAALIGVALSLAHQSRQTAITYAEAQRASHRQLVIMSVEDPDLMVSWEPPRIPVTALEAKQITFTNLIVNNWSTDYVLKRSNDAVLRVVCQAHFRGEIARKHWENAGVSWREYAEALEKPRLRQFVSVMDRAYAEAVASGPPLPSSTYFTS
ncbi:DUF6082 family protein [Streptomyces sp. NRRL F-525]|uniref:DUF6082 family protein n=1 Tax=Streptomyces sp. NRRL F-525 TaxID=1463861 RepID=UPI00131B2888|nr:DUF6082 family protein [Streptomyces sp. NRRL F-525]